jgi:hypothetical protein
VYEDVVQALGILEGEKAKIFRKRVSALNENNTYQKRELFLKMMKNFGTWKWKLN